MTKMKVWDFTGDVYRFQKLVQRNYKATTVAPSERKAYSNIAYRYKQENNLDASANINLDGEMKARE